MKENLEIKNFINREKTDKNIIKPSKIIKNLEKTVKNIEKS